MTTIVIINITQLEFYYENIWSGKNDVTKLRLFIFGKFSFTLLNVFSKFSTMCTCHFYEQKNPEENLVAVTENEWQECLGNAAL
jgi:hypothetical protein